MAPLSHQALAFHFYSRANRSAVFRAAGEVAPGQTRKIELTDTECETSKTFASFLALIRDGQVASGHSKYCFATSEIDLGDEHLFTFLDKWDCSGIKAGLVNELCFRLNVESDYPICPVKLFVLAARANQIEVCTQILTCSSELKWSESTLQNVQDGMCRYPIWSPTSWPLWVHQHCPPVYVWALTRGWEEFNEGIDTLADGFKSLLNDALKDRTSFAEATPSNV